MYSLFNYGFLISHSVRMDAYAQAVGPGVTALDIGTGIFALLAFRLCAHRVYAIE